MRKVIVTEFLSLDGVMEDPGGSEKGEHGGLNLVETKPLGGGTVVAAYAPAESAR